MYLYSLLQRDRYFYISNNGFSDSMVESNDSMVESNDSMVESNDSMVESNDCMVESNVHFFVEFRVNDFLNGSLRNGS
jgi:hypothetical protein